MASDDAMEAGILQVGAEVCQGSGAGTPTPPDGRFFPLPVDGPPARVVEPIEQFFACDHLSPMLQEVSRPFAELARVIVTTLPRNAERTVALRKLLEAKDAAVRARISQ